MYRPTVRYDEVFRSYVDDLFRATHLDRNQIIRAALFAAAHSEEFKELLSPYKKKDVPISSPAWVLDQDGYWLEQCPKVKGGGKDVNAKHRGNEKVDANTGTYERWERGSEQKNGRHEPIARRDGAVPIRTEGGGIKIRIG